MDHGKRGDLTEWSTFDRFFLRWRLWHKWERARQNPSLRCACTRTVSSDRLRRCPREQSPWQVRRPASPRAHRIILLVSPSVELELVENKTACFSGTHPKGSARHITYTWLWLKRPYS